MSIFSPDSIFMRVMSRIGDLLVLNFLFLLTCIPVITIGTACSAMYRVCFRFDTEWEGGLVKTYFRAFRENWKQGTVLWLILLVFGVASAVNAWIFYSLPGLLHYGFIFFGAMLVLVLITAAYAFPLLSQFDSTMKTTLRNAVFMGIGYLPRSLLMTVLNVAPFGCMIVNFYLFLQLGFVWMAVYFAAAAYGNTFLLRKVFAPYLKESEEKSL